MMFTEVTSFQSSISTHFSLPAFVANYFHIGHSHSEQENTTFSTKKKVLFILVLKANAECNFLYRWSNTNSTHLCSLKKGFFCSLNLHVSEAMKGEKKENSFI